MSDLGTDRMAMMATFVRIVDAGTLSAAAKQLGTTQPTVSRRLQALERSLGVRLIQMEDVDEHGCQNRSPGTSGRRQDTLFHLT